MPISPWVPMYIHPGLIGMSLCAFVLSWVVCLLFWLLIFILLYCSGCVSICVVHYSIVFLVIFIHSITTVTFHHSQHLSPHLIYTVWVFSTAIHWWRWLYSHRNLWIIAKCGLLHTKGSWHVTQFNSSEVEQSFFVPDEDPRGRNIVHCNYCTCLATWMLTFTTVDLKP